MVPKWVRGQRERRDRRAGAPRDGDARTRRQRRDPGRRRPGAKCWSSDSFEELDAKASAARGRIVLFNVPFTNYGETVRFRAAGPSRAARHGAVAALVRAVGPPGLRTPHTGALQYAATRRRSPPRRSPPRTPTESQRMADRGNTRRRPPEDGSALRSRRRIGQRRRRDPRPRAARRDRRRRRPSRFVGRRRRRDRRWRRLRGDVGSAAADEEAEPAAAAHGARRAVHQRGERRPRRPGLSRSAPRRARQARDDAGVGRRRVPAARLRLHRQRRGARHGEGDCHAADAASPPIR